MSGQREGSRPNLEEHGGQLLGCFCAARYPQYGNDGQVPKGDLAPHFDYGFNTELMYKDVKLLMQHAENLHVPMFLGRQVTSMWAFAMSQGEGPKDYTNLMKHIERWAGVEVRGKAAKG